MFFLPASKLRLFAANFITVSVIVFPFNGLFAILRRFNRCLSTWSTKPKTTPEKTINNYSDSNKYLQNNFIGNVSGEEADGKNRNCKIIEQKWHKHSELDTRRHDSLFNLSHTTDYTAGSYRITARRIVNNWMDLQSRAIIICLNQAAIFGETSIFKWKPALAVTRLRINYFAAINFRFHFRPTAHQLRPFHFIYWFDQQFVTFI